MRVNATQNVFTNQFSILRRLIEPFILTDAYISYFKVNVTKPLEE